MILRDPEPERAGKFPTKSQVTVHYDVPCSNEAMDSINQSFENHMLSDATSLVPRYEVVVSHSYQSVVDLACEYVPVHLTDFPVVDDNGQKLIPTSPMVVEKEPVCLSIWSSCQCQCIVE